MELEMFLFIMILIVFNGKERWDVMWKIWFFNLEIFYLLVVLRFVIGIKELFLEDMKNVEEENIWYYDIIFFLEFKDVYKDLFSKVL